MQKKKYLFGLAVAMVSFFGFFEGGMEARAADLPCQCGTGNPGFFEPIGTPINLPNSVACDQECANRGTDKYCFNSCIVASSVTKTPTTAGTACHCKYSGAYGGDYLSKGNKTTAEACKTDCQNENAKNSGSITDYCYPKPDCKSIGSAGVDTFVGCFIASEGRCEDYIKGKCPANSTVCPNDGKCNTEKTACAGSNPNPNTNNPSNPATPGTTTSVDFPNPITANSIDEVLTSLLTALSGLVVTLAIVFIVLGGILYMMSAGDPGMIKRAKDCWLFSVIGLAIVVAAPTFLKQVQEILGGNLTGGGIEKALTVSQIATNVLNFLLSLVGIIAIISLVIAGGMYMTAYGDDTRIGTAKKMGTYAIIGIVVALVSLIAVQQVAKLITG